MKKFQKFSQWLSEAVSASSINSVNNIIKSYLGNKLNGKVYKMPGVEEYTNPLGRGYGVRYFYDGNKSIRFNWMNSGLNALALNSVDLWDGTSRDAKWHMDFDTQISVTKALPTIVDFIKSPFGQGTFPLITGLSDDQLQEGADIFEIKSLTEIVLYEDSVDRDSLFSKIVDSMKDGKAVDYSFGAQGTPYKFFNAVKRVAPEFFRKDGQKTIFQGNPEDLAAKKADIFDKLGIVNVTVSAGPKNEKYGTTSQVEEIESVGVEKVAYEEQLKHLEILLNLLVKGKSNALFLAGRGRCLSTDTQIDIYKEEMCNTFIKQDQSAVQFFVDQTKQKYGLEHLSDQEMYSIRDLGFYVDSPDGKTLVTHCIKKTLPGAVLTFANGEVVNCAQNHLIKTLNRGVVFAKDLTDLDDIETKSGSAQVVSVVLNDKTEEFYDIAVESPSHLFYTADGICHHNTGKTETTERVLAKHGLSDGKGYTKLAGTASPVGIYMALYDNRNGIILFDDCDGALGEQDGRNFIKNATDTKKLRKLTYPKKSSTIINADQFAALSGESGERPTSKDGTYLYPNSFEFSGRVIFISNMSLDKLDPDKALRTRGYIIDINPTDGEMFDFMSKIAPKIKLESGKVLPQTEIDEVLEEIRKSPVKNDINLRKLVRGLNIKDEMGDDPMWKTILKLYA